MQPEKLSSQEAELLTFARKLKDDDIQRIIIQVRALATQDKIEYYAFLDDQERNIDPDDV